MKTFNNIYNWEAYSKLKEGKKVCVVDKAWHSCDTLNELTVDKAFAIIKDAAQNQNRYTFWIEEESEEVENEQS